MTDYNLFDGTPSVAADADDNSVNLGTEFYVTATGWVTQIRFLQPSSGTLSTSARQCAIYSTTNGTTGTLVAGPFTMPTPTSGQWCTYTLVTPFQLTANTRYRVVVRHPAGRYAATSAFFTSGSGSTNRTAGITVRPNAANALANRQGSYQYSASMAFSFNVASGACYYSDVTITDVDPSGTTGTLSASTPLVTSSVTGTVTTTGTTSTSTPRATSNATGTVTITGTMSASVPRATSAATGSVTVTGTSSATVPRVTSSATGTVSVTGTASASVPLVTSAAVSTVTVTGTASASVPLVTSSATGTVSGIVTGTLNASVPRITSASSGTITVSATTNATTPGVTGSASGVVSYTGTLTAALPLLKVPTPLGLSNAGEVIVSGTLTTPALPLITAAGTGSVSGAPGAAEMITPWSLAFEIPWLTLDLATPGQTLTLEPTPARTVDIDRPATRVVEIDAPTQTLEVTTPGLTLELDV